MRLFVAPELGAWASLASGEVAWAMLVHSIVGECYEPATSIFVPKRVLLECRGAGLRARWFGSTERDATQAATASGRTPPLSKHPRLPPPERGPLQWPPREWTPARPSGARTFVDVTREAGIDYEHAPDSVLCGGCLPAQVMTGGAAAGDFDQDGYTDLFVTRLDAPDILYRNLGDGSFEDVTEAVGLGGPGRSNGALFGDVDNDGDLDLFVSVVELTPDELGQQYFHLYINEAGQFTDQAIERGVARQGAQLHRGWSAAFGDYDRDGFVDLHLTEWLPNGSVPEGHPIDTNARLFHNLGAFRPLLGLAISKT